MVSGLTGFKVGRGEAGAGLNTEIGREAQLNRLRALQEQRERILAGSQIAGQSIQDKLAQAQFEASQGNWMDDLMGLAGAAGQTYGAISGYGRPPGRGGGGSTWDWAFG